MAKGSRASASAAWGVTPQAALAAARPALCITHAPGCMLVTDRLNRDLLAP
jgi:uncharacterized protein YcsI (UPF0317 family)